MAIFNQITRTQKIVTHSGQKFTLTMISALERAEVGEFYREYLEGASEQEEGDDSSKDMLRYAACDRDSNVHMLVKSLLPGLPDGVSEEDLKAEVSEKFSIDLFDFLVDTARILNRMAPEKEHSEGKTDAPK